MPLPLSIAAMERMHRSYRHPLHSPCSHPVRARGRSMRSGLGLGVRRGFRSTMPRPTHSCSTSLPSTRACAAASRWATGDVTGDGVEDVICAAGNGGGAQVVVFNGQTGALIASWFAYDPSFRGGVRIAAEDLYGNGHSEIVTGPGPGGGPLVEVWDLSSGTPTLVTSFMAYESAFRGGVTVATGVASDGRPYITVGAGPGGGPRVRDLRRRDAGSDLRRLRLRTVLHRRRLRLVRRRPRNWHRHASPGRSRAQRRPASGGPRPRRRFPGQRPGRAGHTPQRTDYRRRRSTDRRGQHPLGCRPGGPTKATWSNGSLSGLAPVGFFEAGFQGGVFVG